MWTQDEMCSLLRNIPVFNGFETDELHQVIPLLEYHRFQAGSRIIQQGERGESMYILYSGSVRVSRSEENHGTVVIDTLYGGSYFGELSLIDNLPRSADVTALEDTEIFHLSKTDLDNLLRINIRSSNKFYRNFLLETFSRFRSTLDNFTFSQHMMQKQEQILDRINRDLSIASILQGYFINAGITNEDTRPSGYSHSFIYEPCETIGGDFLNITQLDNGRVGILIADVEGHGISAALATGVLKSALSIILPQLGHRPSELMRFLNKHLMEVINRLYVTSYYACLDTRQKKITFAKAGHHHPLFWRADVGDFDKVECAGPALGLISEPFFTETEMEYRQGDRVLFFTDGIMEQTNPSGEMYGRKKFLDLASSLFKEGTAEPLRKMVSDARTFAGSENFGDDVTLLLLEF